MDLKVGVKNTVKTAISTRRTYGTLPRISLFTHKYCDVQLSRTALTFSKGLPSVGKSNYVAVSDVASNDR
jgi:hypothetical protein